MAITELYVDPSIAGDSGAGTVGDPYGDLEYAIEQETFDTTNGTRVNVKAGTDEVLVANLDTAMLDTSVSAAWVPSRTVPCIIEGYTAIAGDAGIGGISGNSSVSVYNSATRDGTHFRNIHAHSSGSNIIIRVDSWSSVIACEVNDTTGSGIESGGNFYAMHNYVHNCGNRSIFLGSALSVAAYNYIEDGPNTMLYGIYAGNSSVFRNIIKVGSSTGIGIGGQNQAIVENNSVWGDGGTGTGIKPLNSNYTWQINNNLVEGFSGTGGVGILLQGLTTASHGNAVYDCTTNLDTSAAVLISPANNEILTASPFVDAANGDFRPVNVGNVRNGALPAIIGGGLAPVSNQNYLWKGAVQPQGSDIWAQHMAAQEIARNIG